MDVSKVGDLGNFIRDQRRNARLSLRKLSGMAGISNPYLSQIERGLRRPSAEILQAIARALRISAESLYVKAGILEERGDTPDPVTSVLRDLALTDKQKQVLVEVYQSFLHENELEAKRRGEEGAPVRAVALKAAGAEPKPRAKKTQKRVTAATPKKRPAARATKKTKTKTSKTKTSKARPAKARTPKKR